MVKLRIAMPIATSRGIKPEPTKEVEPPPIANTRILNDA